MLNKVCVMGRLVRDPELRRTQSGVSVTTIRIAVDRDFKSQDGTKQADFFDVVAWQSTAEFVSRYFSKGRMIIVDGRLQTRDWEDRDGNKRVNIEIVANNVYFGDSKRDNAGGDYRSAPPYGSSTSYGSSSGYGNSPAPGYGGSEPASGYGSAPAPGYSGGSGYSSAPASPQSDFSEIAEEDGDLPF